MKRSVAILGPTPQFVRWAIAHRCPLRNIDLENLPDTTFRQLRGLRELSNGLVEHRVIENICIHPDSNSRDVKTARGFPAEEILEAFGNQTHVKDCCDHCPANAVAIQRPAIWAGCYGWLPANGSFQLEVTSSNNTTDANDKGPNLVNMLDDAIKQLGFESEFENRFNKTVPYWYGVWQKRVIKEARCELLLRVFNEVANQLNEQDSSFKTHAIRFRDALAQCVEHELAIHVELLPPGISDGQTWTLFSHCPNCKQQADDFDNANPKEQKCNSCGRFGHPHGRQKNKVLGLRPYMHLPAIMGEAKTRELLERFEDGDN